MCKLANGLRASLKQKYEKAIRVGLISEELKTRKTNQTQNREKERTIIPMNEYTVSVLTFESANTETPPATRREQTYSGTVYLIPYTNAPISITA